MTQKQNKKVQIRWKQHAACFCVKGSMRNSRWDESALLRNPQISAQSGKRPFFIPKYKGDEKSAPHQCAGHGHVASHGNTLPNDAHPCTQRRICRELRKTKAIDIKKYQQHFKPCSISFSYLFKVIMLML